MGIDICYVVNSVSETSVPATLGTALVDHENVNVDILAWFDAEPFASDDRVGLSCINAPKTRSGIDRRTLQRVNKKLQRYDIIQTHTNHSGAFAKLIGAKHGIPLVSREGNTRDGFTREGRIANGITNGLADRIVPNSRAVYESFTRWERLLIDDRDVKIIPNGVNLDWIDRAASSDYDIYEEFNIPEHAIVVGTASVMTEQKAYDTLVHGLATTNDRTDRRVDLVIVGDGPRRSDIETIIQRLGINECVHFAGMVDRNMVYQILGETDIYVMPSRWEGFANAAVEALGARNPCVFSDIDPFLYPYRNVALFHRVDDRHNIADRLVELTESSNLRDFYARRGRKLVEEKYTTERVAREYAELYDDLI